jgi:hypothetical protein
MNDIWEGAWDVLSETFRRIAGSLGQWFPEMSWSAGHSDNEAFAFRAYAAFSLSRGEPEGVVASVDVLRHGDELRYSADIGLGNGPVLADGPAGIIDVASGLAAAAADIDAAVMDITRFLEASESVLRGALRQERS